MEESTHCSNKTRINPILYIFPKNDKKMRSQLGSLITIGFSSKVGVPEESY